MKNLIMISFIQYYPHALGLLILKFVIQNNFNNLV